MICPNCSTQMHQKVVDAPEGRRFIGGGVSTDDRYDTWELKVCDSCGREVIESYTVAVNPGHLMVFSETRIAHTWNNTWNNTSTNDAEPTEEELKESIKKEAEAHMIGLVREPNPTFFTPRELAELIYAEAKIEWHPKPKMYAIRDLESALETILELRLKPH
jgi:hypothetical protein